MGGTVPDALPRPETISYVLGDGSLIGLRPVRPQDRDRLRVGFLRLSARTRLQRFFHGMNSLSEQDLDRLTLVDQWRHVAWGAVDPGSSEETGLAMGRYVLIDDEPTTAEFALVVDDAWHRRGLGTVILALLLVLAEGQGLHTLRGQILSDNQAMLHFMARLGVETSRDNGVSCQVELPVRQAVPAFPDTSAAIRLEDARANLRGLLPRQPE